MGYRIYNYENTTFIFCFLTVMCITEKSHYRAGGQGTAGGNPDGTKILF